MIDQAPEPPVLSEAVIEQRLAACGLAARGISIQSDGDPGAFIITVSVGAGGTPDAFPCIYDAVPGGFFVFEDPALAEGFEAYGIERNRPEIMALAEIKLREIGLWERFPAREAYPALADYLRALEAHAGFVPGSAMREVGPNRVRVEPPIDADAALQDPDRFERLFEALVAIISFAGARDRIAFHFEFQGNDRAAE